MENNCFIQNLIGEVSDKKMAGYLQVADFSELLVGVGYETNKFWKDVEEEKQDSSISTAVDPVAIPYVRNGVIVKSKNSTYKVVKVSAKWNGVYTSRKTAYTDVSGTVVLYITIQRVDQQAITESLTISNILEIVTQAPSMCPSVNNPLIETDFMANQSGDVVFNSVPIGGYILLNYAHSTYPYKITRKYNAGQIEEVVDGQNKTVKVGDKYYRFNGSVWAEI